MRTSSCLQNGCTYVQFSEHMDLRAPFRVTVTMPFHLKNGFSSQIRKGAWSVGVNKESCVASLLDPLHFRSLQ